MGKDVAAFIERGLSRCGFYVFARKTTLTRRQDLPSENYVNKANNAEGGVGYEKTIMTAEIMADLDSNWVVPVLRNNTGDRKVPTFLAGRLHIDFQNDRLYEDQYEELLRSLLDEPVLPIPALGKNPFETVRQYANQKFFPSSEKYVSPATRGRITFDYSNNNGRYSIGCGKLLFETAWSKASDRTIYLLNDPPTSLLSKTSDR